MRLAQNSHLAGAWHSRVLGAISSYHDWVSHFAWIGCDLDHKPAIWNIWHTHTWLLEPHAPMRWFLHSHGRTPKQAARTQNKSRCLTSGLHTARGSLAFQICMSQCRMVSLSIGSWSLPGHVSLRDERNVPGTSSAGSATLNEIAWEIFRFPLVGGFASGYGN